MNDQFDHTYCSLTEMRLASTSFSSSCAHLDTIVSVYFCRTMSIRRSCSDQNLLTTPTFTVIVLGKVRFRTDDSEHFWPLNTHVGCMAWPERDDVCVCVCVCWECETVKSINCLYHDNFIINTNSNCWCVDVVNGLYIWMNLFLPSVQYFRNIVNKCLYCWQFNWAPTNFNPFFHLCIVSSFRKVVFVEMSTRFLCHCCDSLINFLLSVFSISLLLHIHTACTLHYQLLCMFVCI